MTLSKQQRVLMIGALIGAVLGSGTAYLLMTAPSDDKKMQEKPITTGELLAVTGAAAALIRKLDDFRRKL